VERRKGETEGREKEKGKEKMQTLIYFIFTI
jgi:hypothetical protein